MSILNPETKCNLKPEVVNSIQKLHQANIDSAEGFEEAANQIKNTELAADFRTWSQQRRKQASELGGLVECNGKEVDDDTSWLADVHRAYISLRTALSSDDEHAILAEAERGEDHIKAAYEKVLEDTPGTAVNDVLQRQLAEVMKAHDHVRALRDACKSC